MIETAAISMRLVNEIGLPVRVDVRLPRGEAPCPVVVVLPGFKGFKDWGMFPPTASRFAEAGLATVVVNTSRCGVGEGEASDRFVDEEGFAKNTPGRERDDLELVVAAIRSGSLHPRLEADRIGLVGHSRGGGVVLLAAARDSRIRAVVTWASIASFFRYSDRAIDEWRRTGKLDVPNSRTGQMLRLDRSVLEDFEANRAAYDILAACRSIKAPCLFLHGAQDEAVDAGDADRLLDACGAAEKRREILDATGHTFGAAHPWVGPTPAWERVVKASEEWLLRAMT